jgi:hypothetical protein
MIHKIRDERQMKALTGLSFAEFERLLPSFTAVYEADRQTRYEQAWQAGQRQRKPGGGRKSKLPTMADKLLFVLYYYKDYPTFDVLGAKFDLARSKAHERLYELSPLLHETLVRLEMMPQRAFPTVAALMQALDGVDQIILDATERAYHRPQDSKQQQAHYSGKKTPYPKKYGHDHDG